MTKYEFVIHLFIFALSTVMSIITLSGNTDARGFVYSPFNVNIPTSIMSDSKKNKTNKQKGTKRTLYIDKEAYEKVKEDAEEQDRSVSYIINAILKKYYKLTKRDKSED